MKHCIAFIEKWFAIAEWLLQISSLYQCDDNRSKNRKVFYWAYKVIVLILNLFVSISVALALIKLDFTPLLLVINTITIFIHINSLINIYLFAVKGRTINELMISIKNDWKTFQCPEIDYKVSKSIRFYQRCRTAFAITQFTVVTVMNIVPIIMGNVTKRILPFFGWFPFDATVSPFFEIIYVLFLFEQLILILNLITSDYCVFYILGTSIYQLDILHYDYKNVIQKTLNQFDFISTNDLTLKEERATSSIRVPHNESLEKLLSSKAFNKALSSNLNMLIIRHQKLLQFYKKLDKFLMPTVTVRLTITSAAFILETVTGLVVRDINVYLPFLQYATTCLIQLLLYGGSGYILIYKTQNLSKALYDSQWLFCNRNIKRSVLLIQQRCSVPSKITIASWMDLTLESMFAVVRFSFSIATVLRQVLDKK